MSECARGHHVPSDGSWNDRSILREAAGEVDALSRKIAIAGRGKADEYEAAEAAGDLKTMDAIAADAEYPHVPPLASRAAAAGFATVDLSDLEHASYDPPDYIVESLLPCGHVTLLGGHGGSGKSMLALILAAHVADGRDWASLYIERAPAVFVSLEDRGELVRYRLRKIVECYGLDAGRVATGLTILDGTDCPTLATEFVSFGERSLIKTAAMEELADAVRGAGLVIIDNASDAYDGQENERRQVRAFMRMLSELARASNSAVCLLAHIDKTAARYGASGNSYSGSTAWHNSARSRLALIGGDCAIELRQEKLNLGKAHEPIALEWNDRGILRPVAFARRAMDDEHAVYVGLRTAIAAGATVNTATTSAASAAKCLEPYLPPELTGAKGGKRVHRALATLQTSGRIKRATYRDSYRKERERWELAHEGAASE